MRDQTHTSWVWAAFAPQTKLIPALRIGPRTQALAHALVHAVTLALAPGCVPAGTRDGLNLYFYTLTAHFGTWRADPATGKPKWHVALERLYGQGIQAYRRRKIFKVERRMLGGQREDLHATLQRLGFTGPINTACVERINLAPPMAARAWPP